MKPVIGRNLKTGGIMAYWCSGKRKKPIRVGHPGVAE